MGRNEEYLIVHIKNDVSLQDQMEFSLFIEKQFIRNSKYEGLSVGPKGSLIQKNSKGRLSTTSHKPIWHYIEHKYKNFFSSLSLEEIILSAFIIIRLVSLLILLGYLIFKDIYKLNLKIKANLKK